MWGSVRMKLIFKGQLMLCLKDREPFVGHAAPWYHNRVCCLGRKPRRLMR